MAGRRTGEFRVIVSPRAAADIEHIHAFVAIQSPMNADRLVRRFFAAIESLKAMPRRHPRAPEVSRAGGELRHCHVASHRVVYEVLAKEIHVHTVRHGGQRPAKDI